MKIRAFWLLMIGFVLISCGESRVDSKDDISFKKSMEKVRGSLNPSEQQKFDEAVKAIAFADVNNLLDLAAVAPNLEGKIKDKLSGKTGQEIISEGSRILAERRKAQIEQVNKEIAEIQTDIKDGEKKQASAEEAKKQLALFMVERSRFYYLKSEFSFDRDPIIELTVKNNTPHPVSRAYFRAVVASPGRSIPWANASFNYKISGGLEPGESATWKLSPNMFDSDWAGIPRDRADLIMTVTVTKLDGANDETLYNSEFSKDDQQNIKELKDKLKAKIDAHAKLQSEATEK